MVSPDNKIDPTRDVTVRSKELAEKQRKLPLRSFDDVVEQVDERRQKDEEGGTEEKEKGKKRPVSSTKMTEEEDRPLSIFDLVRKQRPSKDDSKQDRQETPQEEIKEIAAPETNKNLPQPIEQRDLSFIPPPLEITPQAPPVKTEEPMPQSTKLRLQEIIDQIVKQVYILKGSEGETDTVVELEGRFKGARLIVKEFDFAKKEMNITIDRLPTASDQQFLNAHRQELIDKLAREHEIVVHIFTATTATEELSFDYKPGQSPQEREQQPREGGQRQRSPYEDTEEEQT